MLRGLAPHPNLIAYRESFLEDAAGVLFIVMSFAEDGDLHRQVEEMTLAKQYIPEHIILYWFRQILSAVQHFHAQGVMHRDLKSSNIFLCDERRRIRIGDFGISRVLESTAFATSSVGTPAYMSPELMRNERYDYHVDMWALGCVVYELCTLRLPFVARSLLDLVFVIMENEPDWSLWSLGGFSDELQIATKRMLRKEAAQRPTAAELLEEGLFNDTSRAARPPGDDVWQQLACTNGDGCPSGPSNATWESMPPEIHLAWGSNGLQPEAHPPSS